MIRSCFIACFLVFALVSTSALAQEKEGAVLLFPESDMDRELADDLTEVLISALIEKSGKSYKVLGKESFKKQLKETLAEGGASCLDKVEQWKKDTNVRLAVPQCVRQVGKARGLKLLVFGKVGKARGGFRLEVWKLSMTDLPDRMPYRKRVPGDLAKLIEEVEAVSDWVLTPDNPYLTVVVNVKGADLFVDGKAVKYEGKPISVAPGKRLVEARKKGYEPGSATVTCQHERFCEAKLELKKIVVVAPPVDDGKVKPPPPKVEERSTLWPYVWVFSGVALLATGGTAYMYSEMLAHEQDAVDFRDETCPDGKCSVSENEFYDGFDPIIADGEDAALWTNVLAGVAVGSAITAVTLMIVEASSDSPAPSTTYFTPLMGPDYSGFAFELTF